MQIDLMALAFIIVGCFVFIIVRQQSTIDRLTDKIMGVVPKNKKAEIKEEDASPREEERLGWHDN